MTIRVNARFATYNDTAETLGVSSQRADRIVHLLTMTESEEQKPVVHRKSAKKASLKKRFALRAKKNASKKRALASKKARKSK